MTSCPVCGQSNPSESRFCGACGKPLPDDKAPSGLVGRIIADRYHVKRVVAEGGMGIVYEAEQPMGEGVRSVAIKTLLPELSQDHVVVSRFVRECAVVASLEHPNTVRVYDFGKTDDGILYIAMEFVRGRPLGDVMAEGKMPLERCLGIVEQMCLALGEAHELGIVHRDLKPDNVVLSERAGIHDFVKILDFGIALRSSHGGKLDTKLTQQGMVLGTPPYMSPEQFTAETPDRTSDIYSLSVIVYEMLNGRLPFEADTPWQWAHHHLSSEPAAFTAQIPKAVERVILAGLSKQRADRPPSALAFYRELALAAGVRSERIRQAGPPNQPIALYPLSSPLPERVVSRTEPSLLLQSSPAYLAKSRIAESGRPDHTEPDVSPREATEPGQRAIATGSRTGTAPDVAAIRHADYAPSSTAGAVPAMGSIGAITEPSALGVASNTSTGTVPGARALVHPGALLKSPSPVRLRSKRRRWGIWALGFGAVCALGAGAAGWAYWYYSDDVVPPLTSVVVPGEPISTVVIAAEQATNGTVVGFGTVRSQSLAQPVTKPRPAVVGPSSPHSDVPSAQGGTSATTVPATPTPPATSSPATPTPANPLPFPLPFPIPTGIFPSPFPQPNPATPATNTPPVTPPSNPPAAGIENCNRATQLAMSDLITAVDQYMICQAAVGDTASRATRNVLTTAGRMRATSLARAGRCQEANAVVAALSKIGAQGPAQRAMAGTPCET